MALDDERCCFCRREVLIREWADRRGWLEVECPVCGLYRAERQFWVTAHFKKARKPVLYRSLARWLAEHRDRAQPPEIPFEGWEAVEVAGGGVDWVPPPASGASSTSPPTSPAAPAPHASPGPGLGPASSPGPGEPSQGPCTLEAAGTELEHRPGG